MMTIQLRINFINNQGIVGVIIVRQIGEINSNEGLLYQDCQKMFASMQIVGKMM